MTHRKPRRAAIYARVSTLDQEPENQLAQLRLYVEARDWTATEFVDRGVSGGRDSRPALDELVRAAKRRQFDVLVCWRLDRLGRNLRHLILLFDDLQAVGVAFVSLNEGIDCTTPAGRLQLHLLGAIAEFERARVAERVKAGLARARTQGKRLGRPALRVSGGRLREVGGLSHADAAGRLGVSVSTIRRWRRAAQKPARNGPDLRPVDVDAAMAGSQCSKSVVLGCRAYQARRLPEGSLAL